MNTHVACNSVANKVPRAGVPGGKLSADALREHGRVCSVCVLVVALLLGAGCDSSEKDFAYGDKVFFMPAEGLRAVRDEWIKGGRRSDFDPGKVLYGSFSDIFFFTNSIVAKGMTYQCRFGVPYHGGTLEGTVAITDDGTIVWIRARDNKVVLDPERARIEP